MTLQIIIKRANKVNQKLRVRKFKSRVLNKLKVKNSFRGRRHARKLEATVFVTKTSRLIRHKVLMGIEKSVVVTKQFFRPAYYGYPDLYVTKKNQHSRMGKGKGKLRGRIQKLKPGAPFLEIFPHDTRFSGR